MDNYITTSIFDIFKLGPGPSSSHTIGPMKAAKKFREQIMTNVDVSTAGSCRIDVYLYGSLSSTGMGHGTHKAVFGGLLGWSPEYCNCDELQKLLIESEREYRIVMGDSELKFSLENIHFMDKGDDLPYSNTLRFTLSADNTVLYEEEYYSIGGGFIKCKGEQEEDLPELCYKYSTMNEFRKLMKRTGMPLDEIILQNEEQLTGRKREEVFAHLDLIIDTMCNAVESGLKKDGLLPGPIGLLRKAGKLFSNAQECPNKSEKALAELNAFAMAASEENASGCRVVTAPTSGASGVIPGIIYTLKNYFKMSEEDLRKGLIAASLIAFIAKHNASIAGAEVGCQGEVGVASAMAAALVTHARGCGIKRVENAAEIALEHHLGLTCDPVDGYVQVPCIERNAVGAVTAFNAYILASIGDPVRQKISFDEVVEAMLETGRDMCEKYRETARGGLALSCVCC